MKNNKIKMLKLIKKKNNMKKLQSKIMKLKMKNQKKKNLKISLKMQHDLDFNNAQVQNEDDEEEHFT